MSSAAVITPPEESPDELARRKRVRRLIITIVLISLGIHLVAGIVAGVVIIARYLIPPPAEFKVVKDIRIPAKQREHRMAMRDFDSMAPRPSFSDRLQSTKPAAFALPELPKLPIEQAMPVDPDMIASPIAGFGGTGNGQGYGNGRGGSQVNFNFKISFFGIRDQGRNVVVLVDTSNSMFTRVRHGQAYHFNFKTIKDETIKLIKGMNINALFNVVIYEGGAMAFSEKSQPATDANKAAAEDWIANLDEDPDATISGRRGSGPKLMEGSGTRLDTGMKMAFRMNPDVIFLITDGEINRGGGHDSTISEKDMLSIIEDLQKAQRQARNDNSEDGEARIHVIQYMTTVAKANEVSTLKSIARRDHGRYRTLQAEEKKD